MNQSFQEIKLTNSVRFSLKLVMKNFLFDVCLWNDTNWRFQVAPDQDCKLNISTRERTTTSNQLFALDLSTNVTLPS